LRSSASCCGVGPREAPAAIDVAPGAPPPELARHRLHRALAHRLVEEGASASPCGVGARDPAGFSSTVRSDGGTTAPSGITARGAAAWIAGLDGDD
jgi:hypothetical protein